MGRLIGMEEPSIPHELLDTAGCLCLAKAMKTVAFGRGPEKRATRSQGYTFFNLFLGSGKKDFVVREIPARGNYEEGCYSLYSSLNVVNQFCEWIYLIARPRKLR